MKSSMKLLAIAFGAAIALTSNALLAQQRGGSGGGRSGGGGSSYSGGGSGYSGSGGYSGGGRSYSGGGRYYGGGGRYYGGGGRYHSNGHSHNNWSLGFTFGAPFWYGPGYYPYAYPYPYPYTYPYYYPPAVIVPPEPRVYVERSDQAGGAEQTSPYWYYCRESDTYYPYVRECAGQWERVPARPQ